MSENKLSTSYVPLFDKNRNKNDSPYVELYYDKTAQLYPDPLSAPRAPTVQQFSINEKCEVLMTSM